MKSLLNKLRGSGGETLGEVLVAMLIIALAAAVLAGMVSAAGSIDMSVREMDDGFYTGLSELEQKKGATVETGQVEIDVNGNKTVIDVNVYKSNGMISYAEKSEDTSGGGAEP